MTCERVQEVKVTDVNWLVLDIKPVGAVSKTTTEKFIELKKDENLIF